MNRLRAILTAWRKRKMRRISDDTHPMQKEIDAASAREFDDPWPRDFVRKLKNSYTTGDELR